MFYTGNTRTTQAKAQNITNTQQQPISTKSSFNLLEGFKKKQATERKKGNDKGEKKERKEKWFKG